MMWSLLIMSLITVSDSQTLIRVGKTSQSSTYVAYSVTYSSERATDGNWNQCANTNENNNNWWRVDLLGLYEVFNITIYNVNAYNTNINGAQIFIGNSSEMSSSNKCQTITNFTLDQNNTYQCVNGSMWGRYVTVYLQNHILILCEVQIYGIKKDAGFKLVSENRTWEDSLNYCRDHNMELAYILDNETQAWAALEAMNATSPFVWLGLLYFCNCTSGVWFWVGDHPLTYENWAPGEKSKYECDMTVAMTTDGNQSWYSKPDNETFNFICII